MDDTYQQNINVTFDKAIEHSKKLEHFMKGYVAWPRRVLKGLAYTASISFVGLNTYALVDGVIKWDTEQIKLAAKGLAISLMLTKFADAYRYKKKETHYKNKAANYLEDMRKVFSDQKKITQQDIVYDAMFICRQALASGQKIDQDFVLKAKEQLNL